MLKASGYLGHRASARRTFRAICSARRGSRLLVGPSYHLGVDASIGGGCYPDRVCLPADTVQCVASWTLDQLPRWATDLLQNCRVGHLGMIDMNGRPRVLPVTYAIHEAAAWTAIDNKPKRSGHEPARVRWLRENPHAALTVDRYEDDWSELRWVQLVGEVAVLDGPPVGDVLHALADRYPQYHADPPPGPVLRLAILRAVWWRAS